METSTRPPWAKKYLRFAAWSQEEFRNLLCGLPPHPLDDTPLPADRPVPTRKEVSDAYVRDEIRRVDADRHMRDAILAGDLKVLEPPDERLLAKIRTDLAPEELAVLRRAVAHDRTCNKAYRVAPDTAVRWAVRRPELFPDFPFNQGDLQVLPGSEASEGSASDELKQHRRSLMRRALRARGYTTQAAFSRKHPEITSDILRAVVNGDSRRAGVAVWTPKVLALLDIAPTDWGGT